MKASQTKAQTCLLILQPFTRPQNLPFQFAQPIFRVGLRVCVCVRLCAPGLCVRALPACFGD